MFVKQKKKKADTGVKDTGALYNLTCYFKYSILYGVHIILLILKEC